MHAVPYRTKERGTIGDRRRIASTGALSQPLSHELRTVNRFRSSCNQSNFWRPFGTAPSAHTAEPCSTTICGSFPQPHGHAGGRLRWLLLGCERPQRGLVKVESVLKPSTFFSPIEKSSPVMVTGWFIQEMSGKRRHTVQMRHSDEKLVLERIASVSPSAPQLRFSARWEPLELD